MIHTIKQIAQALRDAEASPKLRQIHSGLYVDDDPEQLSLGACATAAVAVTLGGLDPATTRVHYQTIVDTVPSLAAKVSVVPGQVDSIFSLLVRMNDADAMPWSEQADRLDAIDPAHVMYPSGLVDPVEPGGQQNDTSSDSK